MKQIQIRYRSTTPLFLGGAKHQAQLRIQSFKGALRFWWRTMQATRFSTVQEMLDEEDRVFGTSRSKIAATDEKVGRSMVQLRLINADTGKSNETIRSGQKLWDKDAANYLGYGLIDFLEGTVDSETRTRSCFQKAEFTIRVHLNDRRLSEEQIEGVEEALQLIGLVGGLGSRSRRGFGSLSIVSWKAKSGTGLTDVPDRLIEPETKIAELIKAGSSALPEWTAWSQQSRAVKVTFRQQDASKDGSDANELLNRIGREFLVYRSWGLGGKVLGKPIAEQNFPDDRDLSRGDPAPSGIQHPKRAVFGLPHNYGKTAREQVMPAGEYDRRASPLFIHIHQPESCGAAGWIPF